GQAYAGMICRGGPPQQGSLGPPALAPSWRAGRPASTARHRQPGFRVEAATPLFTIVVARRAATIAAPGSASCRNFSRGTAVRLTLAVGVLAVLLALATLFPALLADRMQPTIFRTYVGPFEQPGRSRVVELDLGRNPAQPLVLPDIPGAPPPAPEAEQRLYLI